MIFQLEAPGLERKFPPIKSLDNPELRHNLPVQLTSFVGRSKELNELHEFVASNRLVTLVGAGGCGKTRLGLQVASGLFDGTADGVWFVDLAPLSDQGLVVSEVAVVLHVKEEQLEDALATRRLLLVLDNCEHVIEACAKLTERLLRACPRVHILATSREPLGVDGEHVYRVPSLSVGPVLGGPSEAYTPDAVTLFFERARTHRPGFVLDESTTPVVVSICATSTGYPSPWNSPRRGCAHFRWLTSSGVSKIEFDSPLEEAASRSLDIRRCGRPWSGPTRPSAIGIGRCCSASPCSRVGSTYQQQRSFVARP